MLVLAIDVTSLGVICHMSEVRGGKGTRSDCGRRSNIFEVDVTSVVMAIDLTAL